jgi:hypothetical protein
MPDDDLSRRTLSAMHAYSLSYSDALARAEEQHVDWCEDEDCQDDNHAAAFARLSDDIAEMYHD